MIQLPRKDKDGKYYVSYSQITAWNEAKGFDTGKSGKEEYIRKYFLYEKFVDNKGFAQFGKEVEAYITERKEGDKFTDEEKQTLETITPLGVFQHEFKLEYKDFYVLGYIDDCTPDFTAIRDYKTASEKSVKKYHEEAYNQLHVYALALKQQTGKLPKSAEVCAIERFGNGFKGGRNVLTVGKQVWYIPKVLKPANLKQTDALIQQTVKEISNYYTVFTKLNKK